MTGTTPDTGGGTTGSPDSVVVPSDALDAAVETSRDVTNL